MAEWMRDPLTMNVARQASVLLDSITLPLMPSLHAQVLQRAIAGQTAHQNVLRTVSHLLASPPFTMLALQAFRPLLIDLCARWLDEETLDEVDRLDALALLLEIHEEIFPLVSMFLRRPSLSTGPIGFLSTLSDNDIASLPATHLQRLLMIHYRLLKAEPRISDYFNWPVESTIRLLRPPYPDAGVKYIAIRCLSLQSKMSEVERDNLEREHLGALGEFDAPIHLGLVVENGSLKEKIIDGWLMPVVEHYRVHDYRKSLAETKYLTFFDPIGQGQSFIQNSDLHPRVANVAGTLLVRSTSLTPPPTRLVETRPNTIALKTLALQLSRRLPLLITSPAGSGKSLLIQHLADCIFSPAIAAHQIVNIYLSDTSLDAKSLLGSYASSKTRPGAFDWIEGALVSAMRQGKWIVFKDIDRASTEILGMTLPLVESLGLTKGVGERACLDIPSRGRVVATETFMLFATRSVVPSFNREVGEWNYRPSTFLGSHKWHEVTVAPVELSDSEMILRARFPRLTISPLKALLDLWKAIEIEGLKYKASGHSIGALGTPRHMGMRDLEKWIHRVNNLLPASFPYPQSVDSVAQAESSKPLVDIFPNPSLREEIFLETYQVIVGWLPPSSSLLLSTLAIVGGCLGLSEEGWKWTAFSRVPDYDVEKSAISGRIVSARIGHTRLIANVASSPVDLGVPTPFALHRPSLTLLAHLAAATLHIEPLLLVGETGTGKTTTIQHLASLLSQPLTVINLSNQTASTDVLGGLKPVDVRIPAADLQQRFLNLFSDTFSIKRNEEFANRVRLDVNSGKWKRVVRMWRDACKRASIKLSGQISGTGLVDEADTPRKRRKVSRSVEVPDPKTLSDWRAFEDDVAVFEAQHVLAKSPFVFSFVEGPLVKAVRQGHWLLLDEINLASSETLEAINPLLQTPDSSITLIEQGSLEPIPRHPQFRLFASMNPATDVGKKDLPPNMRARFTELWVPPPDDDKDALLAITSQYIGHRALGDTPVLMDVTEFYIQLRRLADSRSISDGSNRCPHYSVRTLSRALTFAADMAPFFGLRRALWEGSLMAFVMVLEENSAEVVRSLAERWIFRNIQNVSGVLSSPSSLPRHFKSPKALVQVGPFYLQKGPLPLASDHQYVLTPSVQTKLMDLARIIACGRYPVLIEGPTSAGKTSAIEYLARHTGHQFVRINNHEHTDIQEYLGTYVSDPGSGKLVFQDGLLVRALREGHWIVLDELNLAPSDVLEALNRLLDDNRELTIPETMETLKPHPHFMLFATQNPAGIYAGRKILSRAFRNRFLEVHFTDVPQNELEIILAERCKIPTSRAQRIVAVFKELQKRRQTARLFETKDSFATLRDLFRWGERDWKEREGLTNQALGEAGYMLLAERTRDPRDKAVVKDVLETVLKIRIDERILYSLDTPTIEFLQHVGATNIPGGLVWTSALRRLYILLSSALRHNEPVLLVGETGCGKTSACELFARLSNMSLITLSCHQNTETADILGGQRPIRNRISILADAIREASVALASVGAVLDDACALDSESLIAAVSAQLRSSSLDKTTFERLQLSLSGLKRSSALFEWTDGPLIRAMRGPAVFLLDEISLADDSVLERLNSVLEPSRKIILAEKGGIGVDQAEIIALPDFKLVATMNPGGDYGKKELSAALRNRFTEIWVPTIDSRNDKMLMIQDIWRGPDLPRFGNALLDFCEWLSSSLIDSSSVGIRDILAWVSFANTMHSLSIPQGDPTPDSIFHHAAHMAILDGLSSLPSVSSMTSSAVSSLLLSARNELARLVPIPSPGPLVFFFNQDAIGIGHFTLPRLHSTGFAPPFQVEAPTIKTNLMRVLRACQLPKPILLEGSPGVGKTSLIVTLAALVGQRLHRINLSDQTDLMDLYGADLPVEGGQAGDFSWRDAAFLLALQNGDWVLLDEMNLAPQTVLEGLNSVLDHRGSVFIPELGRTFTRHPSFRVFAAQNPSHQGGARKGLPKSLLNRFTKVYIQELKELDYSAVCTALFPSIPTETTQRIITFNNHLEAALAFNSLGGLGQPWECNLRDILRWIRLIEHGSPITTGPKAAEYVRSVYIARFRSEEDRHTCWSLFKQAFPDEGSRTLDTALMVTPQFCQVGHRLEHRKPTKALPALRPLYSHRGTLEAVLDGLLLGLLVILTGPPASGKSTLVRTLSKVTGSILQEFSLHPAVDASDLLGGFIQGTLDVVTLNAILTSPSSIDVDLDSSMKQAFHWVDGPLVEAMRRGHWLLLDNANLCSPSVLDRLNSLCEPNGAVALVERGLIDGEVELVTPHRNFRLFLLLDPRNGELSRAMRNRGVEVAVDTPSLPLDINALALHRRSITDSARNSSSQQEAVRRGVAGSHVTDRSCTADLEISGECHLSVIGRLRHLLPLTSHDVIMVEFVMRFCSAAEIRILHRASFATDLACFSSMREHGPSVERLVALATRVKDRIQAERKLPLAFLEGQVSADAFASTLRPECAETTRRDLCTETL